MALKTFYLVDNRTVGQPDPAGDMDSVMDAAASLGAQFSVLNEAYAGGADATGVADSTAAFQAAVSAARAAGGGRVRVPAGTYLITGNVTWDSPGVYFEGDGISATFINFTGSGDCISIYWDGTYSGTTTVGGGVTGITFTGTGASSGAVAVHAGDIESLHFDFAAIGFTGSGACGLHLDNRYNFTERAYGNVRAYGCQAAAIFDVSDNPGPSPHSSHGSFARTALDISVTQNNPTFDGVVLQNGAYIYDGALSIRGNFSSSASALTSAVLRITGSAPAGHASSTSSIFTNRLDIGVEVDNAQANKPQTIVEGTPGTNFVQGTYGVIDFANGAGTFATSNLATGHGGTLAPGAFHHFGPINGDLTLNPGGTSGSSGNHSSICVTGTLLYGRNPLDTSGEFWCRAGDVGELTLTGNTTINLSPGGYSGTPPGAPQRITIILIQAASGGPFTVTWPSNGSPSTSSPTTVWPAGVAPAMPAAASAQLCVLLETYDGATWFGHVVTPNPVSIAGGGTGQVTANAAFAALSPMTTLGDIVYENATPAPARLAGNTTAVPKVLTSAGTGSTAQAPAWTTQNYDLIFGSGSDGAITFDGVANPVAGATLSGSTYTLTRCIQATSITVNSGVTVKPANFLIFCQGTLSGAGTIDYSGANASGSSGGLSAGNSANVASNRAGGAGGTGVSGTGGAGANANYGPAGSAGGAGTSGGAGTGGTTLVSQANATTNVLITPYPILNGVANFGNQTLGWSWGGGGGGGGSDASSNAGGGGGAAGGIVAIFAYAIAMTGSITAKGGNGANGTAGNAGGGGGGAGGLIFTVTLTAPSITTTSVAGGSRGTGAGTGSNGVAGASGSIVSLVLT